MISQLLRCMQNLARRKLLYKTMQLLWLDHLPSPARAVLAAADTEDIDKLAYIAEEILENTKPDQLRIAQVSTSSTDKLL
ncbi:unnamed protein product, partial [Iphiclides podalirius]